MRRALRRPLLLANESVTVVTNLHNYAAKPLFRDPVFDGAADPVVIYNRKRGTWWLVYTNRRANAPGLVGVSYVHATHLGIAESTDGGVTWRYYGIMNLPIGGPEDSHWAPEILFHDGLYHMFLSFVPGIHEDWGGTREMHHLTSTDLENWQHQSELALSSNRVIDACVYRLPGGTWRMWYNNEPDNKAINYADSPDLFTWQDCGKATGDVPGEGPYVFEWHGYYWMIVDIWMGLAVYRSANAENWHRQPFSILEEPGTGEDDCVKGGHAMVQVSGERAYLFYFTHPGRVPHAGDADCYDTRRSSIQVAELEFDGAWINCDRNRPVPIALTP